jgi:hypothetical protein
MSPTAAQLLEEAMSLPREERAELTDGLIATLGGSGVSEDNRLATFRSAVDVGVNQLDSGEGIAVPNGGLRSYLRERGRLATERAGSQHA